MKLENWQLDHRKNKLIKMGFEFDGTAYTWWTIKVTLDQINTLDYKKWSQLEKQIELYQGAIESKERNARG